jgi:hypothetical protein
MREKLFTLSRSQRQGSPWAHEANLSSFQLCSSVSNFVLQFPTLFHVINLRGHAAMLINPAHDSLDRRLLER